VNHSPLPDRTGRHWPMPSMRMTALLMLIASSAVLGGAWFFQYVVRLEPCELCLLERWPYYLGIPVLVVALLLARHRMLAGSILALAAALFLAGTFLSAYHVGVEQRWLAGPTACTASGLDATTIEALKAQLMEQQPVRCDVVQWSLFGVSLAGWNFLASLALVVLCVTGLAAEWRLRRASGAKGRS